jgi:hypothetical protein
MIAALFVATGGAYFGLPDVDTWDEARDARKYSGPHAVVAHPPCSTWCQLAKVNEARYGHEVGSDDGCFASALRSVEAWGGVLEHPAYSHAWPRFGLLRPHRGGWSRDLFASNDGRRAWVTEVSQSAYGHKARKRTWLYYVGENAPPPMDWRDLDGVAWVGNADNQSPKNPKPTLTPKEAKASPAAFRNALIALAVLSRCGDERASAHGTPRARDTDRQARR